MSLLRTPEGHTAKQTSAPRKRTLPGPVCSRLFPARRTCWADIWRPSGQAQGCQNVVGWLIFRGPAGHFKPPFNCERGKRRTDCSTPERSAWERQREKSRSLADTHEETTNHKLSLSRSHSCRLRLKGVSGVVVPHSSWSARSCRSRTLLSLSSETAYLWFGFLLNSHRLRGFSQLS